MNPTQGAFDPRSDSPLYLLKAETECHKIVKRFRLAIVEHSSEEKGLQCFYFANIPHTFSMIPLKTNVLMIAAMR